MSFPQLGDPYSTGGGALSCSEVSELFITNCEFTGNSAVAAGGAMLIVGAALNRANFDTLPGLVIRVCSTSS